MENRTKVKEWKQVLERNLKEAKWKLKQHSISLKQDSMLVKRNLWLEYMAF